MNSMELREYFKKHAVNGPPPTDGLYFVDINVRGLWVNNPCLANIWVDQPEPGQLHAQVGPWEGYLPLGAVLRHCPLNLED